MTYSIIEGGNSGFWHRTSTIDWCEENYIISHFIAEFWNSVSNASFVALALMGVWRSLFSGRSDMLFFWCYASVAVVGLGSFLFHATLTYEMQLMDELPMMFGACCLVFCSLPVWVQQKYGKLVVTLLSLYCAVTVGLYLSYKEPWIHQLAFGILITLTVYGSISIANKSPPLVRSLFIKAVSSYIVAFALWNVDNVFCMELRQLREIVSMQLNSILHFLLPVWDTTSSLLASSFVGSVFQLHAWWHLLSAWGCYTSFACYEYVNLRRQGLDPQMTMLLGIIPVPQIQSLEVKNNTNMEVLAQTATRPKRKTA